MASSRRHLFAAAISIAAGLVAGCAAAPPPVVVPEPSVAVPERWQAAPDAPTGAPDAGWVADLGGETLAALVAEALEGNQDFAAAAARLKAAAAQAVVAGADRRPAADAAFDAARRRQNFLGFPIPGAEDQVLSTTTTTLNLGLRLSWELDLWGRVRAAESAALARVEASAADLAAARLSLSGQVARAWFGLLEAAEQVALAAETADSRRGTRERLRRRYELGLAPPLELRLAIANHAAAEALAAQRRRQLDAAARRLELLAGRYPAGRLPPEVSDAGMPPLPDLAEPATALIAPPDAKRSRRNPSATVAGPTIGPDGTPAAVAETTKIPVDPSATVAEATIGSNESFAGVADTTKIPTDPSATVAVATIGPNGTSATAADAMETPADASATPAEPTIDPNGTSAAATDAMEAPADASAIAAEPTIDPIGTSAAAADAMEAPADASATAAEPPIAPTGPPAAVELPAPPPVPAGVPAELLLRRPDLAAAERRLAAAGLDVESAEAARLPRISLTGSAGRQSQELEDLLDDDFTVWGLAAGLLQPIVQGGRLAAAVDLADARRAEALAAWRAAALTAFAEVEQALAAEGFLAAREAALEEAGTQAAAALDLSLDRWAAGLADYLTVLEAERQTLDARSQLLAARRERLEARVDLHLALGGGFDAETATRQSAQPEPTAASPTLHSPSSPAADGGPGERRGLRPGILESAPLHAPEPFPSSPPAADGGPVERRGLRPGSLEPAQLHAPEPPPPIERRRNAGPSHPPSPSVRGPVPGRSPRRGPPPPPPPSPDDAR